MRVGGRRGGGSRLCCAMLGRFVGESWGCGWSCLLDARRVRSNTLYNIVQARSCGWGLAVNCVHRQQSWAATCCGYRLLHCGVLLRHGRSELRMDGEFAKFVPIMSLVLIRTTSCLSNALLGARAL